MNHPPLTGSRLVWITLALSMSVFMQVLDTTIANVALPTISGNLGAATSQGTWVITSFGVANAIAVPLTGWLAKQIGEVKLFTISTLLFVLTSWMCGMANSLEMLICSRAARRGGRADDSAVTKPADGLLPTRQERAGAGAMGNDGDCGTGIRPDSGRGHQR
jgi:MFS family permease